MKRIVVILMIFCICLMAGCTDESEGHALNENGVPILTDAKKDDLNKSLVKNGVFKAAPNWEYGEAGGECRYYGTFEGYDVIFTKGQAMALSGIGIGDYSFEYTSSFTLRAHKKGTICHLKDLYEQGDISAESIAQIAQIHECYEANQ